MKSANYGIDGPVVLRNLIIIGVASIGIGLLAHFQVLLIPPIFSSILAKICTFIAVFNLACLLLSIWSSKIGKKIEATRILDSYDWNGDEKVLDVGCGRGLMLIFAAKRLVTGKAVGVDIWDNRDQAGNHPENTLKNAQIEEVADRIEIKNSDARKLPFEDNTFDVVVSNKVFHNITNRDERKRAIIEIARVLKPGGWLGIIDSFQYAAILREIGWASAQASGGRFIMFPPVKWTTGIKP
jgi:ubiquinone/menaquinone biosynthesis C-methylase UbiE